MPEVSKQPCIEGAILLSLSISIISSYISIMVLNRKKNKQYVIWF